MLENAQSWYVRTSVWAISVKPHQRNLQPIVATAATGARGAGLLFLNGAH